MKTSDTMDIYNDHIAPRYRIDATGKVRKTGGHRTELDVAVQKLWDGGIKYGFAEDTAEDFMSCLMKQLVNDQEQVGPDNGCTSLETAIDDFIDENHIWVSPDGSTIRKGGENGLDYPLSEVDNLIATWAWGKNKLLDRGDTQFPHKILLSQFQNVAHRRLMQWHTEMRDRVKFRKGSKVRKDIYKILRAIGVKKDRLELDSTMLAHFMWQLKRKLIVNDYTPSLPIMLIFGGVQGTGKTHFLSQRFASPFDGRMCEADLSTVHDGRECGKWLSNVLVNFDEMSLRGANMARVDQTAEILKRMITSGEVQVRTMGTHKQQNFKPRAVFCATTNKNLSEIITDSTGSRRYWVIEAGPVKNGQFDWAALDEIDWVEVWSGIDENREFGYFTSDHALKSQVELIQNEYCISVNVQAWFTELYEPVAGAVPEEKAWLDNTVMGLQKMELPPALLIRKENDLYIDYVDMMKESDTTPVGRANFHNMMIRMGVKQIPTSPRRAAPQYLLYNAELLDKEK